MISVKIRGADTAWGEPDDWEARNGSCATLMVRRERMQGDTEVMLSAWKPSAHELEVLVRGGSVILGVVGTQHPPVLMYVSAED